MRDCSHAGLSRRDALAALGGATISAIAVSGASNARSREGSKMTYVLIHPAWFGGWCWKKLSPLLRAQGHEVFAPTLTGLGERAHLARPEIGLEIHVRDITSVIEYEDLHNVILVGNSSGGMVMTGVADHMPERIARLVFLDAFVPTDGQSMLDVIPPDRRPAMEAFVQKEGDGWLLPRFAPPPWEKLVPEAWQVTEGADLDWILPGFARHRSATSRSRCGARILPPRTCRAPISAPSGRIRALTAMRRPRVRRRGGSRTESRVRTCPTLRIQVSWRPCCWKRRADAPSWQPMTSLSDGGFRPSRCRLRQQFGQFLGRCKDRRAALFDTRLDQRSLQRRSAQRRQALGAFG
jgi:pimeloyl-ACP methyl ester carboxylesterase